VRKFLVTGKNGQVGFELVRALAPLGEVVAVGRSDCDLANPDSLRDCFRSVGPDVVVNPAAYTAVDRAESEPEHARTVNAQAPGILADECARSGALLVHYSTDYVFDGTADAPYTESSPTHPPGVYGRTKLEGEQAIAASGCRHLIFRTSWVFGAHGANFLKTILRLAAERDSLKIVSDQIGAPTSASLLADATAQILGRLTHSPSADLPLGLYHLAAAGHTSWFDYARLVVESARKAGRPIKLAPDALLPIPSSEYPTPAARPKNSRLDTTKFRQSFGLHLPDWTSGVAHVLAQLLSQ